MDMVKIEKWPGINDVVRVEVKGAKGLETQIKEELRQAGFRRVRSQGGVVYTEINEFEGVDDLLNEIEGRLVVIAPDVALEVIVAVWRADQ
jgi:hypothetical protein